MAGYCRVMKIRLSKIKKIEPDVFNYEAVMRKNKNHKI